MRAVPVISCLWPGLPRLWLRGDWSALLTAISFAAMLNFVLLMTFVWTQVLPAPVKIAAWISLGGFWLASALQTLRSSTRGLRRNDKSASAGLFLQAQTEYLRQHWYEAETLFKDCLRADDQDVDASLMLVSLYRRTGRLDAAQEQLRGMSEMRRAATRQVEIRTEQRLLQRLISAEETSAEA